eukprot:Rmarinus@m.13240
MIRFSLLTDAFSRKGCFPQRIRFTALQPTRSELRETHDLSFQQQSILEISHLSNGGVVSVRAGPGTGKTELLARHAALLISNGALPSEILALTHTREAAKELSKRINSFVKSELPHCGTIHALATRTLRKEGKLLPLISITQRKNIVSDILTEKLEFPQHSIENFVLGLSQQSISVTKSFKDPEAGKLEATRRLRYQLKKMEEKLNVRDKGVRHLLTLDVKDFVFNIYSKYMADLENRGCMDFDDQILSTIRLLKENPNVREEIQHRFRHILLDEAQDVTDAQAALVLRLVSKNPKNSFFFVGDPDQTIFGFRGATAQLYDYVKNMGGREVVLNKGFRMSAPIVEAVRATLRGQEWNLP